MDYALIEDGVVVNVIVGPLPDGMEGVAVDSCAVGIGDTYSDGVFMRDGKPLL